MSYSTVDIDGISFARNTAGSGRYSSSCMDVFSSKVQVTGRFCAYTNTAAPNEGGACIGLTTSDAVLHFNINANMADNLPASIYVDSRVGVNDGPNVTCGTTNNRWPAGSYNITGKVCACNEDFVSGTSNTCDSCGILGWDAEQCACVSRLPGHLVELGVAVGLRMRTCMCVDACLNHAAGAHACNPHVHAALHAGCNPGSGPELGLHSSTTSRLAAAGCPSALKSMPLPRACPQAADTSQKAMVNGMCHQTHRLACMSLPLCILALLCLPCTHTLKIK